MEITLLMQYDPVADSVAKALDNIETMMLLCHVYISRITGPFLGEIHWSFVDFP